jgi:hypothetical protein
MTNKILQLYQYANILRIAMLFFKAVLKTIFIFLTIKSFVVTSWAIGKLNDGPMDQHTLFVATKNKERKEGNKA